MLEYQELKIRITADPEGGFKAYAQGPNGNASGTFQAPFSDFELGKLIGKIGRPRQDARSGDAPDLELVERFGGDLFNALFRERIRDLYRDSLTSAESHDKGLRVTLALTEAPVLMRLPWEFLYDDDFLSIQPQTSVVRYLDLLKGKEPKEIEPPLRILALVSSPTDVPPLDVESERQNLEHALRDVDAEITWLEKATTSELQKALWSGPYHVFHYIGHGEFDEHLKDGVLLFEGKDSEAVRVSGRKLATLLKHDALRLAVLNSCEGARGSVEDPFAGVASKLVRERIQAVIAMQFEITDPAAVQFSWGLYGALAAGHPVDLALTEARKAIYLDDNPLEWGTPVLFMRVSDGRIFNVREAQPRPLTPPARPPPREPEPQDEPPPTPSPTEEAPHVWRRRAPVLAAAVVVAVVAGAAAAYTLRGGGGNGASGNGWSVVTAAGANTLSDVASDRAQSGAIAVGKGLLGEPSIWAYDGQRWSPERVRGGSRSGLVNAIAVSGSRAVAAGRVDAEQGDVDAGIWVRTQQGWESTCEDRVCGDAPVGTPGGQIVRAVAATGDGFVAVGSDRARTGDFDAAVWLTRDGHSWTRVTPTDGQLSGVHGQVMTDVIEIGSRRLVAVGRDGQDGAAWISHDGGVSWSMVRQGLFAAGSAVELLAVEKHGPQLVAVGREQRAGKKRAAAWISDDDGLSWEEASVANQSFRGQLMADVVSGQRGLLVVGFDRESPDEPAKAAVWQSGDGRTWMPVASASFSGDGARAMAGVAELAGGTVMAVGAGQVDESGPKEGRIWSSETTGDSG